MAKILLLATNFAGSVSTNGQIARTFFGELRKQGHEVVALVSDRHEKPIETGFPDVRVIRTPRWFLPIIYLVKFISRDVAQWWDIDQLFYRLRAKKEARKLLKQGGIDAIHSICASYSTHMVAAQLKQQTDIPWIAQFYDPWCDNFYRAFKHAFIKRLDTAHEAEVAHHADFIIHSNRTVRSIWRARYGKETDARTVIIPFNLGSVPPLPEEAPAAATAGKRTIVHIGNLYPGRDSFAFIHALESLLKSQPELRSRIAVQYVGGVSQAEKDYIRDQGMEDVFTLVGYLSEQECNAYYLNADVFLALDAPLPRKSAFFPSKIIKYFYFRKPILGITPQGSPSYHAYREGGYESFEHTDREGIIGFLRRALSDYPSLCRFDHNYWRLYTTEHLAQRYCEEVLPSVRSDEN